MSFVRGLSGFIAGAGAGVIAVAAVSLYVPQFQSSDAAQPSLETVDQSNTNTPEAADEAEMIALSTESLPEDVAQNDDTTNVEEENLTTNSVEQEEPKQTDDIAEIKAEIKDAPKLNTAGTNTAVDDVSQNAEVDISPSKETNVEKPKLETSKLVLNSDLSKVEDKPKKFKLPTIEAKKTDEEVIDAAETPTKENNITVGKKPSSKLPKITVEIPKTEVNLDNDGTKFENRALELNATNFVSTDKPLMGVILRDIGDKGLAVDKLKKLNTPITIAILHDAPNASERALEYHAAGFEVIAMASDDHNHPLNTAKNTKQIQDAMNITFNNVPNAIGILDSSQAKLQKNGRTSKAIVNIFVESGHGLITYSKGLNSVDREAMAAGVRTGKVSRKLDENHENKALIGRYLNRVSLDAGRDGSAIVLGTTAKETVAALAGWLLSSKGQSVVIAPASAVLLGK